MISPRFIPLGLSGLGIASGGLLTWLLIDGSQYKITIFNTKTEANEELIKESVEKCGDGSVWWKVISSNRDNSRLSAEIFKNKNDKGKSWSEYQSCISSIEKQEKYKQLFNKTQ